MKERDFFLFRLVPYVGEVSPRPEAAAKTRASSQTAREAREGKDETRAQAGHSCNAGRQRTRLGRPPTRNFRRSGTEASQCRAPPPGHAPAASATSQPAFRILQVYHPSERCDRPSSRTAPSHVLAATRATNIATRSTPTRPRFVLRASVAVQPTTLTPQSGRGG